MNLIDVTQQFPTDEKCLGYIEKMPWHDGIVHCPTCGCDLRYQAAWQKDWNSSTGSACLKSHP
jgi:hypothetical protein